LVNDLIVLRNDLLEKWMKRDAGASNQRIQSIEATTMHATTAMTRWIWNGVAPQRRDIGDGRSNAKEKGALIFPCWPACSVCDDGDEILR
jgi:hypothetical protein